MKTKCLPKGSCTQSEGVGWPGSTEIGARSRPKCIYGTYMCDAGSRVARTSETS